MDNEKRTTKKQAGGNNFRSHINDKYLLLSSKNTSHHPNKINSKPIFRVPILSAGR